MNAEEMRLEINKILSNKHSQESMEKWWKRSRALLDGKTPEEVFVNDPERVLKLVKITEQ